MKSLLILLHIVNKYGVLTTQNKQTKKKRRRKKEEANFKRLHQFVTTNYMLFVSQKKKKNILFNKVTLAQLLSLTPTFRPPPKVTR